MSYKTRVEDALDRLEQQQNYFAVALQDLRGLMEQLNVKYRPVAEAANLGKIDLGQLDPPGVGMTSNGGREAVPGGIRSAEIIPAPEFDWRHVDWGKASAAIPKFACSTCPHYFMSSVGICFHPKSGPGGAIIRSTYTTPAFCPLEATK